MFAIDVNKKPLEQTAPVSFLSSKGIANNHVRMGGEDCCAYAPLVNAAANY